MGCRVARVAVLSAGSWGTAMAKVFADAGSNVTIHARRPEDRRDQRPAPERPVPARLRERDGRPLHPGGVHIPVLRAGIRCARSRVQQFLIAELLPVQPQPRAAPVRRGRRRRSTAIPTAPVRFLHRRLVVLVQDTDPSPAAVLPGQILMSTAVSPS
ncbi:hypothetical protein ACFZDP_51490 [Streptomyces mirabilis]|uniref:hypothetical protein n=1 Tax=Streptomyces mirabilis TaxID=68239 RepID=UPI0036E156F9